MPSVYLFSQKEIASMKKRFFNMIEVLLALAVSAIGITAIMGIIPLGLKANRDAMSDTFAADIANSYFAQLSLDASRASSFSYFVDTDLSFFPLSSASDKGSISFTDHYGSSRTIDYYKNPTTPDMNDWKEDGVIKLTHKFTDDGIDFDTSKASSKHYIRAFVGKKDGDNEVLPDFAADICGWKYYPTDIAEAEGAQTDLIRVYLEVSWPINVPYERREKRVFVREFFNTRAVLLELPEEEVTP